MVKEEQTGECYWLGFQDGYTKGRENGERVALSFVVGMAVVLILMEMS